LKEAQSGPTHCDAYLNTFPVSYFLMRNAISPGTSGAEMGVYGRTIGLPFLSLGPASSTALASTKPATGSKVLGRRNQFAVFGLRIERDAKLTQYFLVTGK
jgi:hypothetical protein